MPIIDSCISYYDRLRPHILNFDFVLYSLQSDFVLYSLQSNFEL